MGREAGALVQARVTEPLTDAQQAHIGPALTAVVARAAAPCPTGTDRGPRTPHPGVPEDTVQALDPHPTNNACGHWRPQRAPAEQPTTTAPMDTEEGMR